MNWLMAHRVAGIAAVNLRRRLGLSDDEYVDVFTALRRTNLMVMGQPMPGLFGAYLPAGPGRYGGILLNSTMGEATIRHTAAHELGHDTMHHGNCLSDDLDSFAAAGARVWTDEEKHAEAFAAWFLMPIRAVKTVLTRLGLDRPREATDVYQLSLHLGTSYRGTLRHLVNLKMVASGVAKAWATIPPARLRATICGQGHDVPARVWDLTTLTDGSLLAVEVGDRLILRAPWLGHTPRLLGPDGVRMRTEPTALAHGEGAEFDVEGHLDAEATLTVGSASGGEAWSVTLLATPPGHEGLIASARPARAAAVVGGAGS